MSQEWGAPIIILESFTVRQARTPGGPTGIRLKLKIITYGKWGAFCRIILFIHHDASSSDENSTRLPSSMLMHLTLGLGKLGLGLLERKVISANTSHVIAATVLGNQGFARWAIHQIVTDSVHNRLDFLQGNDVDRSWRIALGTVEYGFPSRIDGMRRGALGAVLKNLEIQDPSLLEAFIPGSLELLEVFIPGSLELQPFLFSAAEPGPTLLSVIELDFLLIPCESVNLHIAERAVAPRPKALEWKVGRFFFQSMINVESP